MRPPPGRPPSCVRSDFLFYRPVLLAYQPPGKPTGRVSFAVVALKSAQRSAVIFSLDGRGHSASAVVLLCPLLLLPGEIFVPRCVSISPFWDVVLGWLFPVYRGQQIHGVFPIFTESIGVAGCWFLPAPSLTALLLSVRSTVSCLRVVTPLASRFRRLRASASCAPLLHPVVPLSPCSLSLRRSSVFARNASGKRYSNTPFVHSCIGIVAMWPFLS